MSVPDARARLFEFIHKRREVSFSEIQKFVAEEKLYFGGGVYALDVLRSSDEWYTVKIDETKRTVRTAELAAAL